MALSFSTVSQGVMGNLRYKVLDITFDSSYITGGEALTPGSLGWDSIHVVNTQTTDGYNFEWNDSTEKLLAYYSAQASLNTILITDDDSAASNGLLVYVHVDDTVTAEGLLVGHLESVTAGNADTVITLSNGGPTVPILDDDAAATLGDALYFDEDATPVSGRILADLDGTGGDDVFVACSDGSWIRINDDDSASSNGVALYVDDDAANTYERLLAVVPANADGTGSTEPLAGSKRGAGGEVETATDLSAVVVRTVVFGS